MIWLAKPSVGCLEVSVNKMFLDRTVYFKYRTIFNLELAV